MPLSERILMGPGPSNPYPEVTAALTRPMLGHLDPDFLAILDETCDRLRRVFRTANALTLPMSGTGSAGMEAAFVNVVGAGDVVVIGVNGLFGERMCDVASRCGAQVVRVDAPWGQPIPPDNCWPPTPARRSSPSSTPRRLPVSATTWLRSARARATPSCSSTASRRSAASTSPSTIGASTSRTAARRSVSVFRPVCRRSR